MSTAKTDLYIGIDPGASGAAVALTFFGNVYEWVKFSETEPDIAATLRRWKEEGGVCAVIEKVGAMPGQGVSSTFKFGNNTGFIRGVLTTLHIPFEYVMPRKWHAFHGMKKKKDEAKPSWKRRLKELSQQKWPGSKWTLATADAGLIAEYARRKYEGDRIRAQ